MIPGEIKRLKQWCITVLTEREGKARKIPKSIIPGARISPTEPNTWAYFEEVEASLNDREVLPCFAVGNGYVVIDLDNCISDEGQLSELAENVCGAFSDTYIEASISRHGLHIVCKCTESISNIKTKAVEIYTHGHFVTLTGCGNDKLIIDKTKELVELSTWLEKPKREAERKRQQMRERNRTFSVPYEKLTDEQIIEKAEKSRGGAKFKALYAGEWESLGLGDGSQSCADIALMATLAFWSACDENQMARMFRSSALFRNERKLKLALRAAVNGCTAVYRGGGRS